MTRSDRTFKWILWPPHQANDVFDEFVTEGFRIRLGGDSIELVFEGCGAFSFAAARDLADKYTHELRQRWPEGVFVLITVDEFLNRTSPPLGGAITNISARPADTRRAASALREARGALLATGDAALRQCYDYLQTARDNGQHESIFYLYKAIETIENVFGGELEACQTLGVQEELKSVKKIANDGSRDQRHPPKDPARPVVPTNESLVMQQTLTVVRAYERYLLGKFGQ